jgi:hypothetical protein
LFSNRKELEMTTSDKVSALAKKYPDLYITFAGSYDVTKATEHQVCDGSGRDGFVLASAKTRAAAINKAYKERIGTA